MLRPVDRRNRLSGDRGGRDRERNGESCAVFAGGVDVDAAVVGGDDAVADGEAEAGAFAGGLGCEEGVEELFTSGGVDPGAGVFN